MVRLGATIELQESIIDIDLGKIRSIKCIEGICSYVAKTAIRLKGTIWRTTNTDADA